MNNKIAKWAEVADRCFEAIPEDSGRLLLKTWIREENQVKGRAWEQEVSDIDSFPDCRTGGIRQGGKRIEK